MKHQDIISKLTLEEKCYLLSGKDLWQSRSVKAQGVPNMTPSDGPHGIRKQEGTGDQLGLNGSVPATCFPTAATIANSWDPVLSVLLSCPWSVHFTEAECAEIGPGRMAGTAGRLGRSPSLPAVLSVLLLIFRKQSPVPR